MTDYKELKERLRAYARMDKSAGKGASVLAYEDSINAIEELEERLQYAKDNIEEAKEYISFLKGKINSLKHNGYYTGTYIKALMEVEE